MSSSTIITRESLPGRILWEALLELPVITQLHLYREARLARPDRPFVVAGNEDETTDASRVDGWLGQHSNELLLGLVRHHGMDASRLAILEEFNLLGARPQPQSAELRLSFSSSGIVKETVQEVALVASILAEFDAAFRMGLGPAGLESQPGELRLEVGSIKAILSNSLAGAGLLMVLDTLSLGTTLPLTSSLYAPAIAGGALAAWGILGSVNEQWKTWSEGRKASAEAAKARAEAEKAAAEVTHVEDKARVDIGKVQSEGEKLAAEAEAIWAKTPVEMEKMIAEAQNLRASAEKSLAEAEAKRAETAKILLETQMLLANAGGAAAVPASPPPAATVNYEAIKNAAASAGVAPVYVALALNAGLPVFAKAQSQGLQITRMPPQEREAAEAQPQGPLDIVSLVEGIKEAIEKTSNQRENQTEELIEQLRQLRQSFSQRDRAVQETVPESPTVQDVIAGLQYAVQEFGHRTEYNTRHLADQLNRLDESFTEHNKAIKELIERERTAIPRRGPRP